MSEVTTFVTVAVTATDTTTTKTYKVKINKGVDADYGWKAAAYLDGLTAAGNADPRGIWSDGTTWWVADFSDSKIYAYNVETMARNGGKDFNTLGAASNRNPQGIWSYINTK